VSRSEASEGRRVRLKDLSGREVPQWPPEKQIVALHIVASNSTGTSVTRSPRVSICVMAGYPLRPPSIVDTGAPTAASERGAGRTSVRRPCCETQGRRETHVGIRRADLNALDARRLHRAGGRRSAGPFPSPIPLCGRSCSEAEARHGSQAAPFSAHYVTPRGSPAPVFGILCAYCTQKWTSMNHNLLAQA
jgi:hypothetical protein